MAEPHSGPRRPARPAAGAAALLLLTACGSGPPIGEDAAPVERAAVEQGLYPDAEEALLRSSFRLGSVMTAADPARNTVTSPLSALYALAMLRVGAGTTTAEEMDVALALPAEHRDEALNALLRSVGRFDGNPADVDEEDPPREPLLHLANAVFVPEGGGIGEEFLDTLARQYGAGVFPVDFADPVTNSRIDEWVSLETGGRIEEAPLDVDAQTMLSLLNTVYFAAAWDVPFAAEDTMDRAFTLSDGGAVDVPMMRKTDTVRYAEGAGWTGIDLPYGEGFFMRLVLPTEAVTPAWSGDDFMDIARTLDGAEEQYVALELPTWDHECTLDLLDVLGSLGLDETFGPTPDFEAILPDAFVSGGAQTANITVAEKGTIAAAVTQIGVRMTSALPPALSISFDRPFSYQIVHEETGLPVFLGTVADPR
ncbi:hypothetical protein AC792_10210 [Arthrobacter sp. RIT-PI-e]|uniref:serpin family protein n=1 Tax=Arthrobacter sp. RIT-PI-e TaxID=1681197 RepID=UPI0006769693|nr:serpin family protein [Arthrobacter sp. RIT-PI-e]KNC18786.1 hypothetical protein AC792_10210 [Arthrobacter sp. RIT-PI-e]